MTEKTKLGTEEQVEEESSAIVIEVELDLELLDFDDLPLILAVVAASEKGGADEMPATEILAFVQMLRRAVTSDTSTLNLTHWRQVMVGFGEQLKAVLNPTDEATGKN